MRVKEVLKQRGMTAKELAVKLGMTETGLSIAINEKGNPPLKRLQEIAAALEVDITELFSPKGDGFMAVVDYGGKLHRFDSVEALKKFIAEIEK